MICIGELKEENWCAERARDYSPSGAQFFCFVGQNDVAGYSLAHDVMMGLALTENGSGTLAIKNFVADDFFDRPMIGLFV